MSYKLSIILFGLIYTIGLHAQEIRHPISYPKSRCFHCSSQEDWRVISNAALAQTSPFNKVLHLGLKQENDIKRYGTVSFISNNILITTRHCVDKKESLEYIELYSPFKKKWIKINKNEYEVYYYTPEFQAFENDIALIKIISKIKLQSLYRGHFAVLENGLDKDLEKPNVNISGFPCTKFAINSTAPDTLVNRSTSSTLFELNPVKNMIGYPLCMCSGDSGGPIWYQADGEYYIIGVNQGSKSDEQGFDNVALNTGVYINEQVKEWIDSTVKKRTTYKH